MRILVTGANGQLGQTVRRVSEAYNHHHFTFLEKKQLDITDTAAVRNAVRGTDIVLNCAAYTNVDGAEQNEEAATAVNTLGVHNIATGVAEENALLIHISTDFVFGDTANRPIRENSEPAPLNVYGRSKWKGEQAILNSGCRHIIIRSSWLFSPYGQNFVNVMLKLMRERGEVQVVNDQIGSPTSAEDLAQAILTIVDASPRTEGIFHYCNAGMCSWYDFAVAIADIAGISCSIKPCLSEDYRSVAIRPPYSVLDNTKIRAAFNLTIPHWYSSLRQCINAQKGVTNIN